MSKRITAICGFLLSFALAAFASDWDKRTVITVNEPVIVAGVPVVTLQPGEYVMRLMNHDHNRNIVQIFNAREDRLFTTVLAINNYRLVPKDKTALGFWETPLGNPPALRAWFYPGDNFGQEFVYPKGLAARIAHETGEPVLTTPAETVAELGTATVTETTKAGEEIAFEPEISVAAEPAPKVEEVARAEAPVEAFVPSAAVEEPIPAELPATASPFFVIGLIGFAAAMAGIALRRVA